MPSLRQFGRQHNILGKQFVKRQGHVMFTWAYDAQFWVLKALDKVWSLALKKKLGTM